MPLTLFFKYFKGLQDAQGERGSMYVIQRTHKIFTLGEKKNQVNRVTQLPRAQLKN